MKIWKRFFEGVACLLLIILFSPVAVLKAQSTFGSVRGTATDATSAAVMGAQITLHNTYENTDTSAQSDDQGNFVFENVKAGHYTLTATKEGFANAVVNQMELAARQTLRIDVKLSVAAQMQSVEVNAAAVTVNTENATLADSKLNSDITQLPLNARAVSSSPLAALAVSPDVVKDSQGNISVGGATSAQTGFSVDGISTANVRSNGALQNAYPSQEGIAEMKVTAFNNNAEFAQMGDVTFTTKGGTNDFHGSLFEYNQTTALDASVVGFPTKAPTNFNTFGGSIGGPVTIPKVYDGNNKTFLFLDYEGNRKRTSAPELLLVPTQAERNGNLNGFVQGLGLGAVKDPFTGQPYPNNTIPSGNACTSTKDCLNPVAATLLNDWYPLPNVDVNKPSAAYNYQALIPIPSSSNAVDLRVDRTLTSKQQLFTRFSWKSAFYAESNSDGVAMPANNFLPNDNARELDRTFVVSHNYSFSPNLLNEFRFGFTHFTENDQFPIKGADAVSQLGLILSNSINLAAHPDGSAFPTFSFLDGSVTSIGQGRVGTTISQHIQLTDNVTRIMHKHTLRFGLDVRRELYNALMYYAPSDDYGDFQFQGTLTGYSFGDFLLGLPTPASYFAITSPQINAHTWQWGVYGQDEWQVNSHLTLNFGLRWEMLPPFIEKNGDIASFDPALNAAVVPDAFVPYIASSPLLIQINTAVLESFNACSLPNRNTTLACSRFLTASQAGLPQGLRFTPLHDFDPRVSVAYRPFNDEKTVIRAGFGLFTMTTLGPMSFNNAGVALSDLLTFNNSVTNGSATFQFPQTSYSFVQSGGGSYEEADDPRFKDPTSAQWNLTVERQLTPNTIIRLSYVGMGTWHLPATIDLNQIPASTTPYNPVNGWADPRSSYQNWGMLMSSESIGHANYEAGIVEVTHRVSQGLTFQANYTWAKNISNAQGSDAPTGFAGEEPYAVEIADRLNLNYDRGNVVGTPRQRFLLSGNYQLPFAGGKKGWMGAALGGWNLGTVTTIQTGEWLTPTMNPAADQSNTDLNNLRSLGGAIARPDCVGNPIPSNQTAANFYSLSAFALPPVNAGRFGTCGEGILEGPNMINVNMELAKVFSITERLRMRFEASFTNILNRANFAPPATNFSNPSTFGVLTNVLPQGNGGNRTGQLALRLDF